MFIFSAMFLDDRAFQRRERPSRREVQPVDEGVNEADRIIRADVIVHRLRQQQELLALESANVSHPRF